MSRRQGHVLDDGLVFLEFRFLLQYANGETGRETGLAITHVLEARHDLEEGRFAHSVGSDDAYLGPWVKTQVTSSKMTLFPCALRASCIW